MLNQANNSTAQDEKNRWHLEKGIPAALIFALLVQTFAIGVWVSSTNSRLDVVERAIDQKADMSDRLVRVEEGNKTIAQSLARIEARMEARQSVNRGAN
jgi:hypothetical protein